MLTRRDFAKRGLMCGSALLVGFEEATWPIVSASRLKNRFDDDFSGGKQLGVVDFVHSRPLEMDEAQGSELDGRLYTDLSKLSLQEPVIPTEQFYIRTRVSRLLADVKLWRLRVDGLVDKPGSRMIEELRSAAKPLGLHLMECAGNVPLTNFGMISVAGWGGVPLADILENSGVKSEASRVLVTGFDQYATKSMTSVPGASWVFSIGDVKTAGAFLATKMNGNLLTADHGAPIRLVVPGWYGCTCIKWVSAISFLDDTAEATSQMQEYAGRTHQKGVPALARDFQPATIDQAAMPIRIEKWLVGEKIKYRVVGIAWGGNTPVKSLMIRFNPEEDYVAVDHFVQTKNDPWTPWMHAWSPKEPGTYSIRLMAKDPAIRTRRLDSGYYVRSVEISEV